MPESASGAVTYPDLIIEALERYAQRDAFVLGDRRITYAVAADLIGRIAGVLAGAGIGRGRGVGVLSTNDPAVWLVQAATYLLGGRYTGLHPLGSADNHGFICQDAEIGVLVVHPDFSETAAAVAKSAPSVEHVLTLGPAGVGRDLLELAAAAPARCLDRGPAGAEDVAWLPYTGGTTGRPKGVMVSYRAMVAEVLSLSAAWGLPETPRYLLSTPVSHAGVLPVLPVLLRGGTVVLQRSFDPDGWRHAVEAERINYAFVVPTMIFALLDHHHDRRGGAADHDLSSLETVVYGASAISPIRLTEAVETFGPKFLQIYGQTECLGIATNLRKDEHDLARPQLLSSCGRAVTGVRVEVLGNGDEPVHDGQVGELCVRSPVVMSGYWGQAELTAEALRAGWLHTGDLAVRDEQGFFHIVDRLKDLIVTGGFNVYSREVEDVVAELPGVSAVAVVGVPDARWGEAVVAFVVAHPGAEIDPETLKTHVRQRKGPHQAPKRVEFVDRLPTTAVGKADKRALRARLT